MAAVVLTLGATNAYVDGAAAMVRSGAGRTGRRGGPVARLLAAIAVTGLLLIVFYGLRIVGAAELVAVPTTLFLRLPRRDGLRRAGAWPRPGAVSPRCPPAGQAAAMLGFCGWALAIPRPPSRWPLAGAPGPPGTAASCPPGRAGTRARSQCQVKLGPRDDVRAGLRARLPAWVSCSSGKPPRCDTIG